MKWITPVAVGLIVYALPQPDGIKSGGWAVLAIFTGTVLGLIVQPLPLPLGGRIGRPHGHHDHRHVETGLCARRWVERTTLSCDQRSR
ncbi:anion permease [Streptomyces sp. BK239]|uniref:anion permease n=1 Tax=Streptomyces sp. BK239 TaxID=2512155 RepID=UPI0010D72673|nr:sodium:sulfate symporter-like transmembrane protein [Streptomyces sp. BK239]